MPLNVHMKKKKKVRSFLTPTIKQNSLFSGPTIFYAHSTEFVQPKALSAPINAKSFICLTKACSTVGKWLVSQPQARGFKSCYH